MKRVLLFLTSSLLLPHIVFIIVQSDDEGFTQLTRVIDLVVLLVVGHLRVRYFNLIL